MSELFDDEDDDLIAEDAFVAEDENILSTTDATIDARRRLENILEEKRLRDELEDFLDY